MICVMAVWVGLGELVLGTVSILATVTLMAATSFTSQFNWTFYSGPWVLNKTSPVDMIDI